MSFIASKPPFVPSPSRVQSADKSTAQQVTAPLNILDYGENPHGIAPGAPGSPPTWTRADKSGVGRAHSAASHVWFSLAHGIVTEVYFPDPSRAAVRDIGLIVTDQREFFAEEKCDTSQQVRTVEPGVPAYVLTNTCKSSRFRITKEIIVDPGHDVLLQRVRFEPLKGSLEDFHVYAILSPRLGDRGAGNSAAAHRYKGRPMLVAQRDAHALAFACSCGWLRRSVGFVGVSDAWQDLRRNKRMTWQYQRADNGHVALAGEIDLAHCKGEFILATAFDSDPDSAALSAVLSLEEDFNRTFQKYVEQWRDWHRSFGELEENREDRIDTMVLAVHRAPRFGSAVASLAVPWGENRGDDETGGYHLVWPRDMAESAFAFLAAGSKDGEVLRTLQNLRAIQETDGHWPQNMWVNGCPQGRGIQLDEAALPVLLLDLASRNGVISEADVPSFWPMARAAAAYVARNGPVTQEDRWENSPGYSPFTIAVEVAALVLAAQLADRFEGEQCGEYLRDLADEWNSRIEEWTYASGTQLARNLRIDGYYVRLASPGRPINQDRDAATVVSADALALVRYGLRDAKDPRIVNTVRAIDATTRVETPSGPCWHRYIGDQYGEHADGSSPVHKRPVGIGRAWPLLTGERGHYELAAGNLRGAEDALRAMRGFAGETGLIPEQVWDAADIPARGLFRGRPTGSAMPLSWAHAEYIRLRRSIRDKKIFDMPLLVYERYVRGKSESRIRSWRFDRQTDSIPAGKSLRVSVLSPAIVRYSLDGWRTHAEIPTRDTGLGIHFADLPTDRLKSGDRAVFTFRWLADERWEGKDFSVGIDEGAK
jgi:glucoamylase